MTLPMLEGAWLRTCFRDWLAPGAFGLAPKRASVKTLCGMRRGLFAQLASIFDRDGNLAPRMLDGLSGRDLTEALQVYVDRARRGSTDAPLVAGTSKDLLEAIARHVLVERTNGYNEHMPFPGTLLMA